MAVAGGRLALVGFRVDDEENDGVVHEELTENFVRKYATLSPLQNTPSSSNN